LLDFFDIILPIANVEINAALVLIIGIITGIITGLFGLGGGFIIIPFLTLYNLPIGVAVAASVNQMIAGTLSAFMANYHMKKVDLKLGYLMIISGTCGVALGAFSLIQLNKLEHGDTILTWLFLILLSFIAFITTVSSIRLLLKPAHHDDHHHTPKIFKAMPIKRHFDAFAGEISVIPIIFISILGGVFVILLGLGGGFIIIPFLVYVLRCKKDFLGGSLQMQILATSIMSTIFQALEAHTVDIVLSTLLIIGAVVGARIGVSISHALSNKTYQIILSVVLLTVACTMFYKKLSEPVDKFQYTVINDV
jgi:uncharacterized membrane protein YfcA